MLMRTEASALLESFSFYRPVLKLQGNLYAIALQSAVIPIKPVNALIVNINISNILTPFVLIIFEFQYR